MVGLDRHGVVGTTVPTGAHLLQVRIQGVRCFARVRYGLSPVHRPGGGLSEFRARPPPGRAGSWAVADGVFPGGRQGTGGLRTAKV